MRNKIQLPQIKHWLVHPGGVKILDYVEQALELDEDELRHARAVLSEYGNMSSATLLFVLDRHLQKETPEPGGRGTMLDNTLLLFGSASSAFHLARNYPLILAGGRNMGFRHVKTVYKSVEAAMT